jgi:hypothetical protein
MWKVRIHVACAGCQTDMFRLTGEDDGEILRRQLLKASIPNVAFRQKMLAMSGDIAIE